MRNILAYCWFMPARLSLALGRGDVGADLTVRDDDALAFLGTEGEMSRLIAGHDWSLSLGPIAGWPASLKTTVGLMIHSTVPMVLL